MEVIEVERKEQKKEFIHFIYKVYKGDPCYKDTLIGTVKTFLYKNDTFTKQTNIRAVVVKKGHEVVAQCMYIYNEKLLALQIGFFEALPDQSEAVDLLLHEARAECNKYGLNRIVIGLNGHLRYGVGILCDSTNEPIPFDSLYNKQYYTQFFEKHGFNKSTLTEYSFDMDKIRFSQRAIERVYSSFSFRYLNMRKFKDDMLLFGDLCNKTLSETNLYFDSDPICFYELMKEMKPFLKPEHLIFVMKDGREIGFLFWHPDYNEIIPGGRRNSLLEIAIRYLFHKNRIQKMKVNVFGVLSRYRNTGAVIGLLYETFKITRNKYIGGENNFVWDNNNDSKKVNQHMCDRETRHYAVYDIYV